ncbi:MAG: AIR synthase related protein [Clostridia bacterium]|nr:AIR synthase related protein [Clostridia bacterium]
MEIEMISNTVFKRSVLKNIKKNKDVTVKPANAAKDAVVFAMPQSDNVVMSVKTGQNAVIAACNALACRGAKPVAVNVSLTLPRDFEEAYLKQLVRRISDQCGLAETNLGDIAVDVTAGVNTAIITATAVGVYADKPCAGKSGQDNHVQDIVMAGFIGQDGIRDVLGKYGEEAEKYYTRSFIETAAVPDEQLLVTKAAGIALDAGASYVHAAGEGGIFAALWNLAEEINSGIDIDFRKILVKQEIIEVCELFDINPYELSSLGCLLVTSRDGCGIVDLFRRNGLTARIIGRTTHDNAKILRMDDEVRYLDVPRSEEAERIIFDGWNGDRS